jgi:hypothetical protein
MDRHDLIFCREDGTPLRLDALTKRFGQLVAETELPKITLLGLRHSVASELLTKMSAENAAKYLGHGADVLQDTYNHMHPELPRDQVLGSMTLTPPTDPDRDRDGDDSPLRRQGCLRVARTNPLPLPTVIDFGSRRSQRSLDLVRPERFELSAIGLNG